MTQLIERVDRRRHRGVEEQPGLRLSNKKRDNVQNFCVCQIGHCLIDRQTNCRLPLNKVPERNERYYDRIQLGVAEGYRTFFPTSEENVYARLRGDSVAVLGRLGDGVAASRKVREDNVAVLVGLTRVYFGADAIEIVMKRDRPAGKAGIAAVSVLVVEDVSRDRSCWRRRTDDCRTVLEAEFDRCAVAVAQGRAVQDVDRGGALRFGLPGDGEKRARAAKRTRLSAQRRSHKGHWHITERGEI